MTIWTYYFRRDRHWSYDLASPSQQRGLYKIQRFSLFIKKIVTHSSFTAPEMRSNVFSFPDRKHHSTICVSYTQLVPEFVYHRISLASINIYERTTDGTMCNVRCAMLSREEKKHHVNNTPFNYY